MYSPKKIFVAIGVALYLFLVGLWWLIMLPFMLMWIILISFTPIDAPGARSRR